MVRPSPPQEVPLKSTPWMISAPAPQTTLMGLKWANTTMAVHNMAAVSKMSAFGGTHLDYQQTEMVEMDSMDMTYFQGMEDSVDLHDALPDHILDDYYSQVSAETRYATYTVCHSRCSVSTVYAVFSIRHVCFLLCVYFLNFCVSFSLAEDNLFSRELLPEGQSVAVRLRGPGFSCGLSGLLQPPGI